MKAQIHNAEHVDLRGNPVKFTDRCHSTNTHIENWLGRFIGPDNSRILCSVVDAAFGVASLLIVPSLLVASMFMASERAPITSIDTRSLPLPTRTIHPGATVFSPIQVEIQTRRATYHASLVSTATGKVVYEWPTLEANNPHELLGNTSYVIPTGISPGNYSITVKVTYAVNPLVDSSFETTIARFKLED